MNVSVCSSFYFLSQLSPWIIKNSELRDTAAINTQKIFLHSSKYALDIINNSLVDETNTLVRQDWCRVYSAKTEVTHFLLHGGLISLVALQLFHRRCLRLGFIIKQFSAYYFCDWNLRKEPCLNVYTYPEFRIFQESMEFPIKETLEFTHMQNVSDIYYVLLLMSKGSSSFWYSLLFNTGEFLDSNFQKQIHNINI